MSDSVQPHRQQPTRLHHPWDSPVKNTLVGCHILLQCMKVKSERKSLSCVWLLVTPWTAAYQALPSLGFSRREYWSGVPLPSQYMQTTLCEVPGWMKHKLESRLPGEISITSDMQIYNPYGRKWRGTKEPLDESERGEWKIWLKTLHSEKKDHGIWSHHFMANRWGNNGNSDKLYFLGLQNHCRLWQQPWN